VLRVRTVREEGSTSTTDDSYSGLEGARRLINEVDAVLQRAVEHIDLAESSSCVIELRLTDGEVISLNRIHRSGASAETGAR
jgi:hypothetical protein